MHGGFHSRSNVVPALFLIGFGLLLGVNAYGQSESPPPSSAESAAAARTENDPADGLAMNVLVVSPAEEAKTAGEIEKLLGQHGMTVTVVTEENAARERERDYDLVIVTGGPRRTTFRQEFDTAVLGYGSYGCAYFGALRLKNGQPYT